MKYYINKVNVLLAPKNNPILILNIEFQNILNMTLELCFYLRLHINPVIN